MAWPLTDLTQPLPAGGLYCLRCLERCERAALPGPGAIEFAAGPAPLSPSGIDRALWSALVKAHLANCSIR